MDILLVEDSDVVRNEIATLLRDLTVVEDVDARASTSEAREALAGRTFDLWVLDFQLGDGTALDLLEDRESLPASSRPDVVVVSNHASRVVRERCLEAGGDHFFDKGADLDRMVDVVESMAPSIDVG